MLKQMNLVLSKIPKIVKIVIGLPLGCLSLFQFLKSELAHQLYRYLTEPIKIYIGVWYISLALNLLFLALVCYLICKRLFKSKPLYKKTLLDKRIVYESTEFKGVYFCPICIQKGVESELIENNEDLIVTGYDKLYTCSNCTFYI